MDNPIKMILKRMLWGYPYFGNIHVLFKLYVDVILMMILWVLQTTLVHSGTKSSTLFYNGMSINHFYLIISTVTVFGQGTNDSKDESCIFKDRNIMLYINTKNRFGRFVKLFPCRTSRKIKRTDPFAVLPSPPGPTNPES